MPGLYNFSRSSKLRGFDFFFLPRRTVPSSLSGFLRNPFWTIRSYPSSNIPMVSLFKRKERTSTFFLASTNNFFISSGHFCLKSSCMPVSSLSIWALQNTCSQSYDRYGFQKSCIKRPRYSGMIPMASIAFPSFLDRMNIDFIRLSAHFQLGYPRVPSDHRASSGSCALVHAGLFCSIHHLRAGDCCSCCPCLNDAPILRFWRKASLSNPVSLQGHVQAAFSIRRVSCDIITTAPIQLIPFFLLEKTIFC
ncbi:MAG: hypothetical protein BWY96_00760 [Spirochaetes bacterium ADurb.BinA120]|nr:MAG: hypothetical protein BWY96_00760 [Spirochaetes bacterium ADurb.BinA120]